MNSAWQARRNLQRAYVFVDELPLQRSVNVFISTSCDCACLCDMLLAAAQHHNTHKSSERALSANHLSCSRTPFIQNGLLLAILFGRIRIMKPTIQSEQNINRIFSTAVILNNVKAFIIQSQDIKFFHHLRSSPLESSLKTVDYVIHTQIYKQICLCNTTVVIYGSLSDFYTCLSPVPVAKDARMSSWILLMPITNAVQIKAVFLFLPTICSQNKAIIDIRLRPRCAIPPPPSQLIGHIACTQKLSEYYLRLPGILNDPFCCTLHRCCSEWCSEDCQCFWMARTTPKNCPFP